MRRPRQVAHDVGIVRVAGEDRLGVAGDGVAEDQSRRLELLGKRRLRQRHRQGPRAENPSLARSRSGTIRGVAAASSTRLAVAHDPAGVHSACDASSVSTSSAAPPAAGRRIIACTEDRAVIETILAHRRRIRAFRGTGPSVSGAAEAQPPFGAIRPILALPLALARRPPGPRRAPWRSVSCSMPRHAAATTPQVSDRSPLSFLYPTCARASAGSRGRNVRATAVNRAWWPPGFRTADARRGCPPPCAARIRSRAPRRAPR